MTVVVTVYGAMGMAVGDFILTVDMGMAVDMTVLVGMDQASVGVFVGVAMAMLVGVLQGNGILYHQHCCPDHNSKSNIKLDTRSFPEKQHAKQNPKEGCNRIIRTGFRRTQIFLCLDVEIDAETIRNKAQNHHSQDQNNAGNLIPYNQCHD